MATRLGQVVHFDLGSDKTRTIDIFQCEHCDTCVDVPTMTRPDDAGGRCPNCWGLICPRCVRTGVCRPIEKWVEDQERRHRLFLARGHHGVK